MNYLFECSLIGKSNAGKSSIINALAKSKIAKTSKVPGKTKTLNFYDFQKFGLVDMPGYGYVRDKRFKFQLEKIIEDYFLYRERVCGVIHVCSVDNLSEYDLEVKDYLRERFDNYLLVVNKMDKLSKSQQQQRLSEIANQFQLNPSNILMISAKYKTNIHKLLRILSFGAQE